VATALGDDRELATLLGDLSVRRYDGPIRVWRLD
jgi:hypothetical protein